MHRGKGVILNTPLACTCSRLRWAISFCLILSVFLVLSVTNQNAGSLKSTVYQKAVVSLFKVEDVYKFTWALKYCSVLLWRERVLVKSCTNRQSIFLSVPSIFRHRSAFPIVYIITTSTLLALLLHNRKAFDVNINHSVSAARIVLCQPPHL